MNSTYLKLEKIWDACSVKGSNVLIEIIPFLKNCGIRLRQNVDSLKQITLSISITGKRTKGQARLQTSGMTKMKTPRRRDGGVSSGRVYWI